MAILFTTHFLLDLILHAFHIELGQSTESSPSILGFTTHYSLSDHFFFEFLPRLIFKGRVIATVTRTAIPILSVYGISSRARI